MSDDSTFNLNSWWKNALQLPQEQHVGFNFLPGIVLSEDIIFSSDNVAADPL